MRCFRVEQHSHRERIGRSSYLHHCQRNCQHKRTRDSDRCGSGGFFQRYDSSVRRRCNDYNQSTLAARNVKQFELFTRECECTRFIFLHGDAGRSSSGRGLGSDTFQQQCERDGSWERYRAARSDDGGIHRDSGIGGNGPDSGRDGERQQQLADIYPEPSGAGAAIVGKLRADHVGNGPERDVYGDADEGGDKRGDAKPVEQCGGRAERAGNRNH
jgi:hypothetical protein